MFHIVNPRQVWYEDLTGSGESESVVECLSWKTRPGVETISHLRENGRITVLFNAFEGPPRIARLYGRGTVYEFGTPEYNSFIPAESRKPGSRSVIVVDVYKVSTVSQVFLSSYMRFMVTVSRAATLSHSSNSRPTAPDF